MLNGKWTAFILRFSNQGPLMALTTQTHPPTHPPPPSAPSYVILSNRDDHVPDVGALGDDALPATQHGVLHRGQQEALGSQPKHGVDALQPDLRPLQLWTPTHTHTHTHTHIKRLPQEKHTLSAASWTLS